MADLASDGYTILEGAIEASLITELRDALGRLEADLIPANNDFEGRKTLRAYNLLAKGAIWAKVPMHEMFCPWLRISLALNALSLRYLQST